jgi:mannose/fructose-specific phosphotransferase system component IIA
MSEPLRGVVVSHGEVAQALVAAVEQISGVRGALVAVSNTGCDRGLIAQRIGDAVGDRPVFVDLPSGSCLIAAMQRARDGQGIPVVTGVNLPMLLDFVFHRELPAQAAATRVVKAGADSIRQPA